MKDNSLVPSIYVCDGCCCGRVEKGHSEVPIDFLKSEWEKKRLDKKGKSYNFKLSWIL